MSSPVTIYKMNYDKMLDCHKEKARRQRSLSCPFMEEASRFGIMITDDDDNIIDFEEKPANPRSTLASMGIYIFSWPRLRELLVADMDDPNSDHDFGKNIIPTLLNAGDKLVAFKFEGYWKDVGTIDSLWEANMDLLDENCELNLDDPTWKIYTEDSAGLLGLPPISVRTRISTAPTSPGLPRQRQGQNSVIFTGDRRPGRADHRFRPDARRQCRGRRCCYQDSSRIISRSPQAQSSAVLTARRFCCRQQMYKIFRYCPHTVQRVVTGNDIQRKALP